ncbi:LANO_0F08922g1_1 [Lachancea nothofagi CBS 11611]|uniref:Iron-sulfur assembly protein 1 n=1 Tax=Lachancea nothofagi CBS 11611 TaxID=1266666 RepID=A0A1G4K9S5_9SACH|nr:LANO_0F08922g1_1 [Lachancea nothofagi CBS 11611]
MKAVTTYRSLAGLHVSPGSRLFSCMNVLSKRAPNQTSNAEVHGYKSKSFRRFLQTNHSQRSLDSAGPERWSFNFNTGKGSNQAIQEEGHASTGGANTKSAKWSTYSMPSKETLSQQQEQADKQNEAAQKLASQAQTQEPQPAKKQKRKLRPRKALISLTPNALKHLNMLLNQPEPKLIRIGVKNRGCSGLTYDLEFISTPGKFDEVVEQDGVKIIIDSKALFSIVGSEMDWIDDRLSSRFVFKNPNSKGTCGCGESFMV